MNEIVSNRAKKTKDFDKFPALRINGEYTHQMNPSENNPERAAGILFLLLRITYSVGSFPLPLIKTRIFFCTT